MDDPSLCLQEQYESLDGCLDYFETHTHHFPVIPMAGQTVGMLRWESLRHMTPGPHDLSKRIIVGHKSRKGGEILDLGHVICIDTFCHGGGWLTALDVRTGEVWQADREGKMRR